VDPAFEDSETDAPVKGPVAKKRAAVKSKKKQPKASSTRGKRALRRIDNTANITALAASPTGLKKASKRKTAPPAADAVVDKLGQSSEAPERRRSKRSKVTSS
jgi:hypothetical protein